MNIRIIVWNCAMALHRKWAKLLELQPDIAIIPECAEPDRVWTRLKCSPNCDAQWVGNSPHKGLGVFAFNGLSLTRDDCFDPTHKYFLPLRVEGARDFSLLAMWAFGRRAPGIDGKRGTPTAVLLEDYLPFLSSSSSVVAGDFNASAIWDRRGYAGNFTNIASLLGSIGLRSAYHSHTNTDFGKEANPTHFWLKGKGVYHIDYCFLPESWELRSVEVGSQEHWISVSDHAPLVVDCEIRLP